MKNEELIVRTAPDINSGLSNEEVEKRKQLGLTNKTKIVVGKTYLEIILEVKDLSSVEK